MADSDEVGRGFTIDDYVAMIAQRCPTLRSIWLFGSRANGTEHQGSDWDLLAFGDSAALELLQSDRTLERPGLVDLLVAIGDEIFRPWIGKELSLSRDFQWCANGTLAYYTATKPVNGDEWNVKTRRLQARQLWSAEGQRAPK
jgi:predicted nucleotidyltransferase